jgi:O-antigen ligase
MAKIPRPTTKAPMNWLLWGAFAVTAVLWTTLNDPFNAPKSWVLSTAAFWLFGWLIFQVRANFKVSTLRWATLISGSFLVAMFIAYIATDNKFYGFFGAYQRRTGFLSYFCLTVFFLSAAFLIRINHVQLFEKIALFIGSFLGIYGFLQHFKIDLTTWNNPFNSVMSTLGNPDFAAACMAIFLIINFGLALQKNNARWIRVFACANVLLLFIVIYFSQVRQGLLVSMLGIALILIVFAYQKSRVVGAILFGSTFFIGVLSIFGMLGKGPLVHYFYKISVTFRGDYWRAGVNMFKHHLVFGVGLDRYGAYFRQYRDLRQVLRRGPDLVSNAAHNVPIQLAATGGIFVLLTYLLLTGFVFWRGLISLKRTSGMQQIIIATFFAAWIGYEAQSLISIDNLGIAIWGYVLGGVVIGLSIPDEEESIISKSSKKMIIPILSGGLALVMFTVSILFYKSEHALYNQRNLHPPTNQQENVLFLQNMNRPVSFGFREPVFEFTIALRLAQSGDFTIAIKKLKALTADDPRYYDAFKLLAEIYEYQKDLQSGINIREKMIKIDPFNSANFLQLGEDYKTSGNSKAAKTIIPLINAIDSTSTQAKQAMKDLG